jgi:hypothetical protein
MGNKMTKSEVKELINYLKTKLGGDENKIEKEFDDYYLSGKWFIFDENTDDHILSIDIEWFPKDPKDLEEIKDED